MRTPRLTRQRKARRKNRRKNRRQTNTLQIEQLEPRLLLAADIGGAAAPDGLSFEGQSNSFLPDTITYQTNGVPLLNSNPGAAATLFLDFDGHFESSWGNYGDVTTPVFDFDGDSASFNAEELTFMLDVWQIAAEDYSPFDMNVTTVEPYELRSSADSSEANGKALRSSIGGTNDVLGEGSSISGYAYINSFTSSIGNVTYTFPASSTGSQRTSTSTGSTVSHEAGHAFGLEHLSGAYDTGLEWQAIMSSINWGYEDRTWHSGIDIYENPQNDITHIGRTANQFGYRADDHGSAIANATPLNGAGTEFSGSGIIGVDSNGVGNDVDMFSITTTEAKSLKIVVEGSELRQNLDAIVELLDSNGNVLVTGNPSDSFDAELIGEVDGTQFIRVKSTGEYGRIGQYRVSVTESLSGLTISAPSSLTTSEAGLTSSFTVTLDSKPTANVVINVVSSDPDEGSALTPQVVFTPQNWYQSQTIIVAGVDDQIVELPTAYELSFTATSSDSNYNGLAIPDVIALTNIDDDAPGWAFAITGSEGVKSKDIQIDSVGNVFITGSYTGTVDFDPGAGEQNLTSQTLDDYDGFIAKYSPSGDIVWVRGFGGADGSDNGSEIAFDNDGNIYLAGYSYAPTATFGAFTLTSQGGADAFVTKLDDDGNFLWLRSWGNENSDTTYGVSVSDSGMIHVAGGFSGTVDFDPGNGVYEITSNADSGDAYLLNLDSNGNFVSAIAYGGSGTDGAYRVVAGENNDVYLTGKFKETVDFGNGIVLTSKGSYDSYLMKVSVNGGAIDTQWVQAAAGPGNVYQSRIAVDGNGGLYFSAYFSDTIDFGPGTPAMESAGSTDSFITKWDTDGNLIWSRQISGEERNRVSDITIDSNGNPWFVGNFAGTVSLSLSAEATQLTSIGTTDGNYGDRFVLNLSASDGSTQYVSQILESTSHSYAASIAADAAGNVFLSNTIKEAVTLPTGDTLIADANGVYGNYVMKLTMAPGVTISPSVGLMTGENGDAASFSLVLDVAPTDDVTIGLSSSDPGEGSVSHTSLTFTPSNWNVAQIVTITGVNDEVIDGDVGYTVITSSVVSNDPGYDGLNPADVTVVNVDDDQPITLFEDSFEVGEWNGLWVEDSQNDWRRQTQRATDGISSAEVDGRATNATLTIASPIDLSDMQSSTLTFDWLIESGYDKNEFLSLDISTDGGSTWDQDVRRLDGNIDSENVWHNETVDLSGYSTSSFKFRFRSTVSRSSEDANVDSVLVVGIPAGPANEAPVAGNDSYNMLEDGSLSVAANGVLANDSDADGDALSAVLVSGAANGSVTLYADGSFDYTPDDNFYGTEIFSYVSNDGTSDSNVATVSIVVDPVNDAPVAANDNVITNEDTPLLINASSLLSNDNDIDLDSLSISSVSQPNHGTLTDNGNGTYTYSPGSNFNGSDSFGYTISDANSGTDSATVSITVTPVNDAPTTTGISGVMVDEDADPTDINLFTAFSDIEDLDGDLVLSITGNTNPGLFSSTSIAAGILSLNYAANANGSSDITVRATDTGGLFVETTFGVTVNPVNDAPVADSQSVMVKQETSRSITLTGSDVDGDALSFAIFAGPLNGLLSGTGANRIYSPNSGFTGSDSFTFIATDGTDDSDTVTVSINVAANNIPVSDAQSVNVNEDGSVAIALTGSDPDLDAITYSLTSDVSNGNLTGTAPDLIYVPDPNYNGPDSFTFIVNDGTDDSPAATVSINVAPVNDVPVAVPQSVTTDEDTPAAITLTGSDIDGDTLTYVVVASPANGNLSGSGATRTYTPNADFNGSDSFTFKVNDGTVDSGAVTVSINVTPVNDAPVADSQSVSIDQDTSVAITLSGSDIDGDSLTFSVASGPTSGSLAGQERT